MYVNLANFFLLCCVGCCVFVLFGFLGMSAVGNRCFEVLFLCVGTRGILQATL
jgi:hypothetical protein